MSTDELARRRRGRGDAAALERADTWARYREAAEEHPCEPPPLGCAAPTGTTCHVIGRPDLPLGRQPAHLSRLRKAGVAAPSTIPTQRPDPAPGRTRP